MATLAQGSANGGTRGSTILIVDDDAPIRAFVKQALAGEGYVVREAADGAAALAAVEREAVDLVLLDLWMPVMDGWQFAQAYQRLDGPALPGGRAPLVVFTAERGVRAAEHAETIKAAGFLTKPFDIEELLEVVRRCARPDSNGGGEPHETPRREPESVTPAVPAVLAAPVMGLSAAPVPTTSPAPPVGNGVGNGTEGSLGHNGRESFEKLTREQIQRQQHVERLKRSLAKLQEDMGRVRSGVAQVAEIETSRRLSRDEAKWAGQLRMESERLRYELQLIREEFFRVRNERG